MRRAVVFLIALLMIVLLFLILGRRAHMRDSTQAPSNRNSNLTEGSPSTGKRGAQRENTPLRGAHKPDPLAARRALGKALGAISPEHWLLRAHALEEMHDGAYPEYRSFAREFIAAAGSEIVPIVESLLAECQSPGARYLLISVLGDARAPEAVPLLKKVLNGEADRGSVRTALFSIGMSNTDEGFLFLTEFVQLGKAGYSRDPMNNLGPALAALGQQGDRSLDFLLEEARRQTTDRESPNPSIIGGVRGKDAARRLQSLVRDDPDPMIRLGAAMALASTKDATQLESLATLDPVTAGRALLAARNRPDIWNDSAANRRKVADGIFAAAGSPTGDYQRDSALLEAAMLLPPDRTRPLMESLVAKPPRDQNREELIRFVAAFADQPDVVSRAYQLGKVWGLSETDCEYMVDEGTKAGALPGRALHPATIERLFQIVGDPASMEWQRQQAMSSLMLFGVPAATQSEALSRMWEQNLNQVQRREILGAVGIGIHSSMPSKGTLLGTKPNQFLSRIILRETQDPTLQAWAAHSYYSGSAPSTDPVVQKTLDSFLRYSTASTTQDHSISPHLLFYAMVDHFAIHGTPADLPMLSHRVADFLGPASDEASRVRVVHELQEQLNYAIDSIRFRSN